MPTNLLKSYSNLLEILHLAEPKRIISLKSVFERDIENNTDFKFNQKQIWPMKGEEPAMQLLFRHLTTREFEETQEDGKVIKRRTFDYQRSERLHWIRFHIEKRTLDHMEWFSVDERVREKNVTRTYILDNNQRYVIILELQRTKTDYTLITAYQLEPRNFLKIKNKAKRKLKDLL